MLGTLTPQKTVQQHCSSPLTSWIGSARGVLNTVSNVSSGLSTATAIAGATPVTFELEGVALGLRLVSGGSQLLLAGVNLYDAKVNGNSAPLISQGVGFAADGDNLLTGGSAGTGLFYDPLARLNVVPDDGGTVFAYAGGMLVGEYTSTGALKRRYLPGDVADEVLVQYEGTGTTRRYLATDERGSVTEVSDDAGSTLAINQYDDWGIPAAGNLGRFGYTGQTWLPSVQAWNYKARVYNPALGRFHQTDPIASEMHLYRYAGGDPVNAIDPSGLAAVTCNDGKHSFPEGTPSGPGGDTPCAPYGGDKELIVSGSRGNPFSFDFSDPFGDTKSDLNALLSLFEATLTNAYNLDLQSAKDARAEQKALRAPQKTPVRRNSPAYCKARVGLGIGLDVVGTVASAIPGTGAALAATQLGFSAASALYSSATHNNQGLAVAATGYGLTAAGLEAGNKAVEKAIPVAGALIGAAQTLSDVKTAQEDYESCLAGN